MVPKKVFIDQDKPSLSIKYRKRSIVIKVEYIQDYFTTNFPYMYKFSKTISIDTLNNVIYGTGQYDPIFINETVKTYGTYYKGFKFKIDTKELRDGTYLILAGSPKMKQKDSVIIH